MGQVGSFGDVAFEASDERVLTWNDCQRETKANYAVHEVIDDKARLQYLGQALQEFSLAITLDASFCTPETEIRRLDHMQRSGRAYRLILGGRIFGKFVLESKSENRARTDGSGGLVLVYVQLKLKEYH